MDEEHTALPLDSDIEVDERAGRPVPARLGTGDVAQVFCGGAIGTAAREALTRAISPVGEIPVSIFLINLVGAFLLGVLLETLARRGPDRGRRRAARLLLGTGVIGGFTTYSALALDSAALIGHGAWPVGVGYAGVSLIAGLVVCWAGIATARTRVSRQR